MFLFVFTLSNFGMVTAQAPAYETDSGNQCSNPSLTLAIKGQSGESYNVSTLSAPVSTCVRITFYNSDTIGHTFTIAANSADNVSYFNIYLPGGKTNSSNFLTPSSAVNLQYYCQVPGHEANGMFGTLKVGSSTKSSPGFEVTSVFIGLLAVGGLVIVSKKKRSS